jgi:hypothetical protein
LAFGAVGEGKVVYSRGRDVVRVGKLKYTTSPGVAVAIVVKVVVRVAPQIVGSSEIAAIVWLLISKDRRLEGNPRSGAKKHEQNLS